MVATQKRYSILITDDDRGVRETLGEIVETKGLRPVLAEIVQHEPIHLVLLDYQMPRLTGLETLQLVRQINALLPAILITADATREVLSAAYRAQVFSVVPKPVNPHLVLNLVIRALGRVYGTVDDPPPQPTFGEPTP
jgi:DNA-binding NtrC family response regulator